MLQANDHLQLRSFPILRLRQTAARVHLETKMQKYCAGATMHSYEGHHLRKSKPHATPRRGDGRGTDMRFVDFLTRELQGQQLRIRSVAAVTCPRGSRD